MAYIGKTPTPAPLTSSDIPDSIITDAKIVGMTSSKLSGALPAISGSSLTGIASDMVKLADVDVTSGSSVSIDGHFSSTYKSYELIISECHFASATWLKVRFNVSGSTHTGGNWNFVTEHNERNSSSHTNGNYGNFNQDYCPTTYHSSDNSGERVRRIYFANPLVSDKYKMIRVITAHYNTSATVMTEDVGGYWHGTTGVTSGITLFPNASTTFSRLKAQLYGTK